MLLSLRLVILALLVLFVLFALAVHLRGRARLRFDRQLVDHSVVLAPYNLLMYAFSAVPAKPILDRAGFPQLDLLRENWRTIRDEAAQLFDLGLIRTSEAHNDASFESFFKRGWKRFYLKWYGEPLPSAEALCPRTVALLRQLPGAKAAMFALLPPGSVLKPHRDPFAGSLRYHLGLITPNSEDCRIFIDGNVYVWRDGEDIVFDETYVHWAENRTDQTRVILFADFERPLCTHALTRINKRVGAFLGKITASPNDASDNTGVVNRAYAWAYRVRRHRGKLKSRYPRTVRGTKYTLIAAVLWLILLAPWPFVG